MHNIIGRFLLLLPYCWVSGLLDTYEPNKAHVIACQRESVQVVQCQHERAAFLWQPATKKQFQLRQVKVVIHQTSGDNCNVILNLETDRDTIEIKDFGCDASPANLMQARFGSLLYNPSERGGTQMRYGTSLYTVLAHVLLFGLILWIMMGIPWDVISPED
jgi:hypothetical protein